MAVIMRRKPSASVPPLAVANRSPAQPALVPSRDHMTRLTIVCWKWHAPGYRTSYTAEHVNILFAQFKRRMSEPFRMICVTDDPDGVECETYPLWDDCSQLRNPSGDHFPCCYRRLRVFDVDTTRAMAIKDGDRVLSIDLDVTVLKDPAHLFRHSDAFVGWKRIGSFHPVAYNGTIFLFRAGRMQHLWSDFDPTSSPEEARNARYFGSDQGWMSYKLAGKVPGWTRSDGIYSYSSDVSHKRLPENAVIVSFNGKRKPWDPVVLQNDPWIRDHWRL